MELKKIKTFTLSLLLGAIASTEGQSMDLLPQAFASTLGVPVTREQSDILARNPSVSLKLKEVIDNRYLTPSEFFEEYALDPQKPVGAIIVDKRVKRELAARVGVTPEGQAALLDVVRIMATENLPGNISDVIMNEAIACAVQLRGAGVNRTLYNLVALKALNERGEALTQANIEKKADDLRKALPIHELGQAIQEAPFVLSGPEEAEKQRLRAEGIPHPNLIQISEGLRLKNLGGGFAGGVSQDQLNAALYLQNKGGAAIINDPNEDQVKGAAAFIAVDHNPPEPEVNGWVEDDAVGRAARVLVGAAGLDATDVNLIAGAAHAAAVGIAHPTEHQVRGAEYLIRTLHIADATEGQINGVAAFMAGGDNNPTELEVNEWVANHATRASRVLVGAADLDATDVNLIAGAAHAAAVGIAHPTADQINGAAAFIAGGDNNPTELEVNGWVANHATRASRVLVGATGLDATDTGFIAGAARAADVGIVRPTEDQIRGADRLVRTLHIADATEDQINGAAAFIAVGHNPTAPEVNGWVANHAMRAARVHVGAAGLNAADARLIAAAMHATVTVGIANPTASQIKGAAAFIAGGDAGATQAEIDGWSADDAVGRAARVLVGAAGLDATDTGFIAGAARAANVGIANPTEHQIRGADHLIRMLGIEAATQDQINGAAAFIAGGHRTPTAPEVNGWVGDHATRAARVLVGAAGLDATDTGFIAGAAHAANVRIARPTEHQIRGVGYLTSTLGIGAPTKGEIEAVALLWVEQYASGRRIPDPRPEQIEALANLDLTLDMKKETAWHIQAYDSIPGAVAQVIPSLNGDLELRIIRLNKWDHFFFRHQHGADLATMQRTSEELEKWRQKDSSAYMIKVKDFSAALKRYDRGRVELNEVVTFMTLAFDETSEIFDIAIDVNQHP